MVDRDSAPPALLSRPPSVSSQCPPASTLPRPAWSSRQLAGASSAHHDVDVGMANCKGSRGPPLATLLELVACLACLSSATAVHTEPLAQPLVEPLAEPSTPAVRTGRAAVVLPQPTLMAGDEEEEDVPFQSCLTPDGEPGHCRHVRFCVLREFKDDFNRFKDYACVIEGRYIGVCCPDDKDISDTSRDYTPSNRSMADGGRWPARPSRTRRRKPRPTRPVGDRGAGSASGTGGQRFRVGGDSCGVTQLAPRGQIAKVEGGQEAEPGAFPWMVALLRGGQQQFCGGVLLDSKHVLTAAHCVYNLEAADLTVGLGEYDLSQPDPDRVQLFDVDDILVNERFNSDAYTDDIAILYLAGEAVFGDYVWPICLPPPDMDLTGQLAVVIGWGTVYYGGPPSNVLMEVTIPVWSQEDCQRQFDQPILDTEICAGSEQGGRDSCQGDSGGPLLLQMSDGRWCNIGIVSFGVRCGEPGKPGVYTNVGKYLDWIAQNTRR